MGLSEV
jgi:hypothetical protein